MDRLHPTNSSRRFLGILKLRWVQWLNMIVFRYVLKSDETSPLVIILGRRRRGRNNARTVRQRHRNTLPMSPNRFIVLNLLWLVYAERNMSEQPQLPGLHYSLLRDIESEGFLIWGGAKIFRGVTERGVMGALLVRFTVPPPLIKDLEYIFNFPTSYGTSSFRIVYV
jgi:hypothetical protein